MNQSAEAFIERLQRHDIKYMENPQPDGSHYVAVELAGNNGSLYNVVMVFGADGAEFRIRIFQLQATQGTAYDDLQKNSGHYTNYLIIE